MGLIPTPLEKRRQEWIYFFEALLDAAPQRVIPMYNRDTLIKDLADTAARMYDSGPPS